MIKILSWRAGMIWESSIWNIYITVGKTDSQWEFALRLKELKAGALWQPRGAAWGGRWEGGVRGRGHMCTYGWFMLMYGSNHRDIAKELSSN